MGLTLLQKEEYIGKDRWRWSIWLDGQPHELDGVDHVTYILDPTFHNPVRHVTDRSTNFRLDTSGWGTFTIHALVADRSGNETTLHHNLVLHYPDGTPTLA